MHTPYTHATDGVWTVQDNLLEPILSFHHEGPHVELRPLVSVAGTFTHWPILLPHNLVHICAHWGIYELFWGANQLGVEEAKEAVVYGILPLPSL